MLDQTKLFRVFRTLPGLHGGSLKYTLIVPLIRFMLRGILVKSLKTIITSNKQKIAQVYGDHRKNKFQF